MRRNPVSAHSLEILSNIFYEPNPGSKPGEVAWFGFVSATEDAGFSGKKRRESDWPFKPIGNESQFPISIHDPHGSFMRHRVARRIGRCLNRRSGRTLDKYSCGVDDTGWFMNGKELDIAFDVWLFE